MKKLITLLLLLFISGCEASVESDIEERLPIEAEVIEDVFDPSLVEADVATPNVIAVMGSNMPAGSFQLLTDRLEFSFDWYSFPDLSKLSDYELIYFFYDDLQQQRLEAEGYSLPDLRPYEAVRQRYGSTDIVWINFTRDRLKEEAVSNFIIDYSLINETALLLIEPFVIDPNKSTYLVDPGVCKVPHDPRIFNVYVEESLGFPRPERRLPHDRNSKALVLHVAFPDYPASKSVSELNHDFNNRFNNLFNDYILAMSNGLVEHEFYFHDEVIMMPRSIESYYLTFEAAAIAPPLPMGDDYVELFVRELIEIVDPTVDFTGYDYVLIMTDPSIPTTKANFDWLTTVDEQDAYNTEEQPLYNLVFLTNSTLRPNHEWVALHEVMHLYGLVDYYSRIEGNWGGDAFVGSFDLMSRAMGRNNELLLWSRWFIGWAQENEIDCLDGRETISESIHTIQNTVGNEGTKGVIIRISQYQLLLIERKERSDYCQSCNGGLIVTNYSSSISSAYGLLKIIRPEGSVDPDFEDAFLTQGTILTKNGLQIEVLEQNDTESVVSISTVIVN